MAEDCLDVADIGAVVEHGGGHGVAEDVAGAARGDASVFQVPAHEIAKIAGIERVAELVYEHRSRRAA